ncbi:mitochondrial ribosomal protein L53 [Lycorma delicatula]|uniref:mitochondrial ribosomal protein L53 n=1 Tax=Lycorma delicatula TaxID=130591 RepID=UPI003F51A781
MSIPFTGILRGSSGGLSSGIAKQINSLNLKPVKRILLKFDPFTPESVETRSFLYSITSKKARDSNPACPIKTEVLCDRSEPSVHFQLTNGESVIFKSKNLTALEMLKLVNQHITVLAPKEEPAAPIVTKTQKRK